MIDTFSSKLTGLIRENLEGITEEKAEIIEYGINLIVYEIIVLFVFFSISLFLGVFKYLFIAFFVYGSLRILAGGAHANTRMICTVTYFFMMFGTVYLSKYLPAEHFYYSIPVFMTGMLVIYKYAPGDTAEKPILSKKIRKMLKRGSLAYIFLLFAAAVVIWHYDRILYNVVTISVIPVIFLLTPAGYRSLSCKHGWKDENQA